jgi:hypothetical protein
VERLVDDPLLMRSLRGFGVDCSMIDLSNIASTPLPAPAAYQPATQCTAEPPPPAYSETMCPPPYCEPPPAYAPPAYASPAKPAAAAEDSWVPTKPKPAEAPAPAPAPAPLPEPVAAAVPVPEPQEEVVKPEPKKRGRKTAK